MLIIHLNVKNVSAKRRRERGKYCRNRPQQIYKMWQVGVAFSLIINCLPLGGAVVFCGACNTNNPTSNAVAESGEDVLVKVATENNSSCNVLSKRLSALAVLPMHRDDDNDCNLTSIERNAPQMVLRYGIVASKRSKRAWMS